MIVIRPKTPPKYPPDDVAASATPSSVTEGDTVTLSGSATPHGNDVIATYEWDETSDGTYDYSGPTVGHTHVYNTAGMYAATLRATTNRGHSRTATVVVTVANPGPPGPEVGPPYPRFANVYGTFLRNHTATDIKSTDQDPLPTSNTYLDSWLRQDLFIGSGADFAYDMQYRLHGAGQGLPKYKDNVSAIAAGKPMRLPAYFEYFSLADVRSSNPDADFMANAETEEWLKHSGSPATSENRMTGGWGFLADYAGHEAAIQDWIIAKFEAEFKSGGVVNSQYGTLDGVFLDVFNGPWVGYPQGIVTAIHDLGLLVIVNGYEIIETPPTNCDGMLDEGTLTRMVRGVGSGNPQPANFAAWYAWYMAWVAAGNYNIIYTYNRQTGGGSGSLYDDDERMMRYGLTACLLGNGYFSHDRYNTSHGHDWWYPEYDVALGYPTGAATVRPDGAYQREFDNGTVVCNPTASPVTVTFETNHDEILSASGVLVGTSGATSFTCPAVPDGRIYVPSA